MKKILTIFMLLFMILFTACSEKKDNESEDGKGEKYESMSNSMSQNTTLSQSSIEEISIKIETAVCSMCERTIKNAVKKLDGVIETDINADTKTAVIKYDGKLVLPPALRKAISNAGYNADDVKRNENAYNKLDECCKIENGKHG
jgi:periplasmic mercuric ion binding protein